MKVTRQGQLLLVGGLLAIALPAAAQTGPAPAATHLPGDVLVQGCAPSVAFEEQDRPLRITGVQDVMRRVVFAPGDLVTVNAGADDGITVGQEYFVRRVQRMRGAAASRTNPATIRTAGWIRIHAVDEKMSLATVTYACDALEANDYLEPFSMPTVPAATKERLKAQRGNYGRVMIGNDRKYQFGKGDHFVVDRGSDHGVTEGARFVVYHDKRTDGNFLVEIAEAVAVDVKADTSTLMVTLSRDAIAVNDYVALRK